MSPVSTLDRTKLPFELYPDQKIAEASIWAAWNGDRRPTGKGVENRLLMTKATGGGKTVIAASVISKIISNSERALFLVDRETLVFQAEEEFHSMLPGANIGLVKAEYNDHRGKNLVIGSVQTLMHDHRLEDLDPFDVVICDEADLAVAPSWTKVVDHFERIGTRVRILGVTATPNRTDKKPVVGPKAPFREEVCNQPILQGIREGWLSDGVWRSVTVEGLDLTAAAQARGDQFDDRAGEAYIKANTGKQIAVALRNPENFAMRDDGGLKPFIVFASNIAAVNAITADLQAENIRVAIIIGTTHKDDRKLYKQQLRAGEIDGIVSCDALTRGFDAKFIEVVVIARPTASETLFLQMLGRGTRLSPETGKAFWVLLDMVEAEDRFDLVSMDTLFGTDGVKPKQGERLTDAIERRDQAVMAELEIEPPATGKQRGRTVPLYDDSAEMWIPTDLGTMFIPARPVDAPRGAPGLLFFLKPLLAEPELFYVFTMSDRGRWKRPDGTSDAIVLEERMEEELAKKWAEKYAREQDPTISSKSAPWRKKGAPSDKQLAHWGLKGKVHGVDYTTQGQASNLIAKAVAESCGL